MNIKMIIYRLKRNYFINILLLVIFTMGMLSGLIAFGNMQKKEVYNQYINSYLDMEGLYSLEIRVNREDATYYEELEKKWTTEDMEYYQGSYFVHLEEVLSEKGKDFFGIDEVDNYIGVPIAIEALKNNDTFNFKSNYQPFTEDFPHGSVFLTKGFGMNIKFPLSEGRNFSEEDFLISETDSFTCIAGAKFKEHYKIGDIIKIQTYEMSYDVKIIGFLEEGVPILEDFAFLKMVDGDSLLMVGFNADNTTSEYLKLVQKYIFSVGSFVKTDNPKNVETLMFNQGVADGYEGSGTFFRLVNLSEYYKDASDMAYESNSSYLLIFIAFSGLLIFMTALSVYLSIRKNRYEMGIYLMCGAVKGNLKRQILGEYAVVLLIAIVLSGFMYWKYFDSIKNSWILIIFALFILLLVYLISSLLLLKKKIVYFLKKEV